MSAVKKFEWIDFGRGIAILLVIMVHTGQTFASSAWLQQVTGFGDMGVQLFFMLSAITLMHSYKNRFDKDGSDRVRFFLIRRFFRISPLYYAAAVFYTLVTIYFMGWQEVAFWKVVLSIFYLNGFVLSAISYIPPGGWSIAVEMLFYLLLPLLFKWVKKWQQALWLLLIALLLSNLVNIAAKYYIEQYTTCSYIDLRGWELYFWLPNQFPVFCFGILLYFLLQSFTPTSQQRMVLILLSVPAFGALTQYAFSLEYPAYFFQREYACAVIFCIFLAGIKDLPFAGRYGEWIKKIGRHSFCMYLAHFFCIRILTAVALKLVAFQNTDWYFIPAYLTITGMSYAMAALLSGYERQGIALGNRIIERIKAKRSRVSY